MAALHEMFRPVQRSSAPWEVVSQIRDMIARGQLRSGDRLPSERVLAERLDVGRPTVREAMRIMESQGFIRVRPGDGTYLSGPAPSRDTGSPGSHVPPAWGNRLNLFELRAVLEPGLAALAARRATPEQIADMRTTLARQQARVAAGGSGAAEDAAFHFQVAEATGNAALVSLISSLIHLLQETRDQSLQQADRAERSIRENRAVLSAIEERRPRLAMRRMRAHIRSLERLLLAAPPPSAGARSVAAPPQGVAWHAQREVDHVGCHD